MNVRARVQTEIICTRSPNSDAYEHVMSLDVEIEAGVRLFADSQGALKGTANLKPIRIHRVYDTIFSGQVNRQMMNLLT